MGLQAMYDLTKASKEHGRTIEHDVHPHATP
jgi:hypothetical protein